MRRPPPSWITAGSTALLVVCSFLPWVQTGEARRSSYRLLRDLATLGVLHGGRATAGRVAWVLLPALAASCLLLVSIGRPRSAALAAGLAGLIGLGGAVVVRRAPVVALAGADLMLVVAPLTLVLSLVTAWSGAGPPVARRPSGAPPPT